MSATANQPDYGTEFASSVPLCRILILHDDYSSYTRALEVCRHLMKRFADDLDFDVKSWSAGELAQIIGSRHAAKTAATADIVLLCLKTAALPVELANWLDRNFVARFKTDGVLALMVDNPSAPPTILARTLSQLNQVAARLNVDFLSLTSDNNGLLKIAVPPTQVSRDLTLASELTERPVCDHWGINE